MKPEMVAINAAKIRPLKDFMVDCFAEENATTTIYSKLRFVSLVEIPLNESDELEVASFLVRLHQPTSLRLCGCVMGKQKIG